MVLSRRSEKVLNPMLKLSGIDSGCLPDDIEQQLMIKMATLNTSQAAKILGRTVSTLRTWSSRGDGPLVPVKINGARGALRWRVTDILRILNGNEVNG